MMINRTPSVGFSPILPSKKKEIKYNKMEANVKESSYDKVVRLIEESEKPVDTNTQRDRDDKKKFVVPRQR